MDTDITQLAKRMRARRAAGSAPYVLLLGSSLSLTSEVRRAVCGGEDWGTFWTIVEKMSPAERRAAFKGPLERLLLAEGYRALTRLLAAGYFEVVFTLNVDDTLEDELRVLKADEYRIWVYGEVTSAELVAALEYRSPRVKVLKLRGDVNAHKLPLTPEAQFEFPLDLEGAVRQWLSRDTMVVGDLPFDDDVWRCLRGGDGALWVVQTSEVSETSEVLRRVKQVRQKGEVITAESFNAFFTALADTLEVEEVKPDWVLPPQNPYQGLEAFTQDKARFFFGRERLTDKLLERLRRERFLAVVGASGSGKSSVVQAGLLHRLAQGALPGSAAWPTVICRPGELVNALARLLRDTEGIQADEQRDLLAQVSTDETAIHVIAERVLRDALPDHRLVLVVDQFEELFTLESSVYREQVIAALLYAARVAGGRTTVVVTLRSDFYARVAEYDELFVWMEQHREFLPPMSKTELHEAIQRPARLVKFPLGSALPETILADVGQEPGALPLLQYALKELYDRCQEGLKPTQAYQEIGGVQGALEHRADAVYQNLSDRQQKIARHILIRLTQLGEGTEDTRRRATFDELVTPTISLDKIETVIDILAAAQTRLLVTDDPDKERPGQVRMVEVAHEALIRGWKRLQDWLNEDRAGLLTHRRLTEAAIEWERSKRDGSYLYRGARLVEAKEWAKAHATDLNRLEKEFLDNSTMAHKRAQTRQVEVGLAALLLVIGTLALFAIVQNRAAMRESNLAATAVAERDRADLQAQISLSRQLAAQAEMERSTSGGSLTLAGLLAAESLNYSRNFEASTTIYRILERLGRVSHIEHKNSVSSMAFSSNRNWVMSIGLDGTALMWEIATGREAVRVKLESGLTAAAFSPDGRRVVSGEPDGIARVWEAFTGREMAHMEHKDAVVAVDFSPDGQWVVSGSGNTALVWEATTGREIAHLEHRNTVNAVAFSPDGRWIVSGWDDQQACCSGLTYYFWVDGGALVWEAGNGRVVEGISGGLVGIRVSAVAFSPDGQKVVLGWSTRPSSAGPATGGVAMIDLTSEQLISRIDQLSPVHAVTFSFDGQWVASGSTDGAIRVWEAATGQAVVRMKHDGRVDAVAFSPDGQWMVSGGGNTVQVWEVTSAREVSRIEHPGAIGTVAFSPDGQQVISGSQDGTVLVWKPTVGWKVASIEHGPTAAAFSPDGLRVVSGNWDGVVQVWDVISGEEVTRMEQQDTVVAVAFSPNGQWVASGSADGTIQIWEAATEREVTSISYNGPMNAMTFSLDGRLVMAGNQDGTVRLWEASTGREVVRIGHHDVLSVMAFSSEGQWMVSRDQDGTVRVWEVHTGREMARIEHDDTVTALSVTSDEQWVALGSQDGKVQVWEVGSEREVARVEHEDAVRVLAFSPDGRWVVSGSQDYPMRMWEVASGKEGVPYMEDSWRVRTVVFSANGQWVASGYMSMAMAGVDGRAAVWDVATGQEWIRIEETGTVDVLAFEPNGRWVVLRGSDTGIWVAPSGLAKEICSRLSHNLTTAEWRQYIGDEPYRATCPNLPMPEEASAP